MSDTKRAIAGVFISACIMLGIGSVYVGAAMADPSESASPSASVSVSASASKSASASTTPSKSATPSQSASKSVSASASNGPTGAGLPVTGDRVWVLLFSGLALFVFGLLIIGVLRMRKRPRFEA